MDVEGIIYLIFLLIWFVSGIAAQIRKMSGRDPDSASEADEPFVPPVPMEKSVPARTSLPRARTSPPPVPTRPAPPPHPPDVMREIFRQLGVEMVEQPVASEHRGTASEHRRTASEHRQSLGETRATASEHRRTVSETRRTASEHRQTAGELRGTASEHRRGDVRVPIRAASAPVETRRRVTSRVVREVRHELLNGPQTLKKALVLKEILDKPIGLRSS